MNKKILKYLTIPLGVFLLNTSCNNFLDVDPTQRAYLSSPEDVSKLLVNAYPQAVHMEMMEIMSDNVGDNSRWTGNGQILMESGLAGLQQEQMYYWDRINGDGQDMPDYYWYNAYLAIASANIAIEFIKNSDHPEDFSGQLGEALVCRAYAHFMLTVLYCKPYSDNAINDLGIPYITKPETVVFTHHERGNLQQTYDLIQADIEKGLPLIDDGTYKIGKYHFTKVAANAFASRFYLFKHDWDKVITYANAAIGDNPVSMLRDWNGINGLKTLAAEQLAIVYNDYMEPANLLVQEAYSWYAFVYNGCRYLLVNDISDMIYGSSHTTNVTGGVFAAYPNLSWANNSIDEVFIYKYKNWTNAEHTLYYIIQHLFSVEEILLNRAEAYAMKSDVDNVCRDLNYYYSKRIENYNAAIHMINATKINTFANNLPDNLYPVGYDFPNNDVKNQVKVIVDSRRKEFIHEGNRWFDIKRFNIEVTHKSYDGTTRTEVLRKDDPRRQLLLPQMAVESGTEQNPR
jgi:hypothetical protein